MNKLVKLIVAILAVAAVLAMPAMAEDTGTTEKTQKIVKGVKLGLSMATLTGEDSEGLDSRIGLAGGAFVRVPIGEQLSIQPEVNYVQKGAEESAIGITLKIKMDYVEIPVLLRYEFPAGGSVLPCLYAGPMVAFKVVSDMTAEALGTSLDLGIANQKSTDFGLVIGGGIDVGMGSSAITFDLRFAVGLAEQFDDVDPFDYAEVYAQGLDFPVAWEDTGKAAKLKTSAITLTAGFAF